MLSTVKKLQKLSLFPFFKNENASFDHAAATAASTLNSLAAAVAHNS